MLLIVVHNVVSNVYLTFYGRYGRYMYVVWMFFLPARLLQYLQEFSR